MKPGGAWPLVGVGVAGGLIVGFLVVSMLSSHGVCSGSLAESEITVRIVGDATAVHDVRLCTAEGCSASALVEVEREQRGGSLSTTPETGAPITPTPPAHGSAGAFLPEFPTGPESPPPVAPSPRATSTADDGLSFPRFTGIVNGTPREWVFEVGLEHPDRVSVAAYGVDGRRIGARTAHLEWSSAQTACPTGQVTPPVKLRVGS